MSRGVKDHRAQYLAFRLILSGILILLCFQRSTLHAQSVVLTWNPSTDPAVAGFKIYSGTVSHSYTNVVVVGNVTNASITGLTYGTTYYFAATTYDDAGDESQFSTEASFSVPPLISPPTYPVITLQPTNTMTLVGSTVELSVVAAGQAPLLYQWDFDGVRIATGVQPTLTIKNVTTAQSGLYEVTVFNDLGTTNSLGVQLSVYSTVGELQAAINQANQEAAQAAQLTNEQSAVLSIVSTNDAVLTSLTKTNGQFRFQVSGFAATNYVIQASSNLINWVSLQTNLSPFSFTDSNAGGYAQRFYRALEMK